MSGERHAKLVDALLSRVGRLIGSKTFISTIRRRSSESDEPTNPWDSPADPPNDPDYFELTGILDVREARDENGTLIGKTKRTLFLSALGEQPLKSDTVAVGVARSEIDSETVFDEIDEVRSYSPGDTVLLHELDLVD